MRYSTECRVSSEYPNVKAAAADDATHMRDIYSRKKSRNLVKRARALRLFPQNLICFNECQNNWGKFGTKLFSLLVCLFSVGICSIYVVYIFRSI